MIILLLIYLLFLIAFDHWAQDNAVWWGIYYFVQYGMIAGVSMLEFFRTRRSMFIFMAVPFAALAVDEVGGVVYYSQPYQMACGPVFNFTLFAIALFIIYEVIQWRKREHLRKLK